MRWEDKIFGIPVNTVSYALFYNKEIFKEVGIDTLPETWDDIKRISKKLTDLTRKAILKE